MSHTVNPAEKNTALTSICCVLVMVYAVFFSAGKSDKQQRLIENVCILAESRAGV